MKEKMAVAGDLKIRQETWKEAPCSRCKETPCCRNLPLSAFQMTRRCDFINLLLASSYKGVFPALKPSGEWSIYLGRDCQLLDLNSGKCTIHSDKSQSLICKSYDAHNCWYLDAFGQKTYRTLISFNKERLLWFKEEYDLSKNGFDSVWNWEELCRLIRIFSEKEPEREGLYTHEQLPYRLSFRDARSKNYLFVPPYKKPVHINHFELISFRLGFPGVYLAISDTVWSFMIKTAPIFSAWDDIHRNYFPGLEHKHFMYSFDTIEKEYQPSSKIGNRWLIIGRRELNIVKDLIVTDTFGNIKRLPDSLEILNALRYKSPDRAA